MVEFGSARERESVRFMRRTIEVKDFHNGLVCVRVDRDKSLSQITCRRPSDSCVG
jgi:hypothetical protein